MRRVSRQRIEPLSLEAGTLTNEMSGSHQAIVFETDPVFRMLTELAVAALTFG
jgi:hypothetical protein